MRALFTRRRRPATDWTALTVDKAASRVCDLDRRHGAFPLFR